MERVETPHGEEGDLRIYDAVAVRPGFLSKSVMAPCRLAERVALDFIAIVVAQEGKAVLWFQHDNASSFTWPGLVGPSVAWPSGRVGKLDIGGVWRAIGLHK